MNASDIQTILANNTEFCEHLGYKITEQEKALPVIYWIPKMHKSPVGKRFIIASKVCSTKQLSKDVSKVFKLLFRQTRNFHDKSHFYSNYVSGKSAYWTHNRNLSFTNHSLKSSVRFLISECHFVIGNLVFTQDIGIPMGIDPAPFWANLSLIQ